MNALPEDEAASAALQKRILAAAEDTGVPPRVPARCGECGQPCTGRRCGCLGVPQEEVA